MLQKKLLIGSIVTAIVLPVSAFYTKADATELVITDNGTGSSNSVSVNTQNNTTSSQTNNADVTNQTSVNANTGGNSTDSNSGNSSISTGNVDVANSTSNDVNHNQSQQSNCACDSAGQAVISGNGSDSTNSVGYNSTVTSNVYSTNNAHITNITNGTADTGNNHADNNLGNVSITTGNIKVKETNKTVANSNNIHLFTGGNGEFSIKIAGNGAGSVNTFTLNQTNENTVNVSNNSDILNLNLWNLITGNNTANDNQGNVSIKTGDIDLTVDIQNVLNTNEVTVECGCQPTPPPPPCTHDCGPITPPSNPPSNGGGGGGGGSSSGGPGVLAAATGPVLPATGNPWILFAIIGNLLMLFFGAVLRLKSGRSPGVALAI